MSNVRTFAGGVFRECIIMKVSRLLPVFSACFVLFGCASSPPPSSLASLADQKQVDRAVKGAVEGGQVLGESVLRDGDKVALALRWLESGDKLVGELYLRANCVTGGADWAYADLLNRGTTPHKKERRYANGASLYAPPLALSESVARAVHQLDAVKKACERTPSWRELAYNKKNETQLLLEVSSLQTQADGSVRFWAAVDYPHLAYIRLYKAPYARRAGLYQVDCRKQTYSLLHVYYLDQQQTITDGGMQTRPPVLGISQATGDSAVMLSTVCSHEDLSSTLLPPDSRSKRLPNFSVLPEPDANVAAQLARRGHLPPRRSINAVRVGGTRSSLAGSAAARQNRSVMFQQSILVEPTSIPGVFHLVKQEGDNRTEQMSFLGMIPISQMLYNAEEQSVFQVDRLELRGDWAQMSVGSQLGYSQRARVTDLMTNQSNRESEVICRVANVVAAAELHSQLQGSAKELRCHVVGGKIDEISTYYYLEDYGFGFLLGSRSDRFVVNSRVTEVR